MKPKLWIFEGPDNIGKTTASESLACLLGDWPTYHMSRPEQSFNYSSDYFDGVGTGQVWDRFHLGGLVYGKMAGLHPNSVTLEKLAYIMLRLKYEFDARVVLMYAENAQWYEKRLLESSREEMYDIEQMQFTADCYKKLARQPLNLTSIDCLPFAHIMWPVDRLGFPKEENLVQWMS